MGGFSKHWYKRFKFSTKRLPYHFHVSHIVLSIYLQYLRKNFNKRSKTENPQIDLFCLTDLSLSNSKRNCSNNNLLNMKTCSILLKLLLKFFCWPANLLSALGGSATIRIPSNRKSLFQNGVIYLPGLVCFSSSTAAADLTLVGPVFLSWSFEISLKRGIKIIPVSWKL